ncbi:MAG: hypothetical protein ACXWL2_02330 [Candidatus Chromulinivorax sp.]
MYKKIALLLVLFCSLPEYAFDLAPWLQVKPSYFFCVSSPMNDIYNHGGFQIQTSSSIPFSDYVDLYASFGYRQLSGHALNSLEETTLSVLPFDIGLKPVINFGEHYNYFFAIGPRFFYFTQVNNSSYVNHQVNRAGLGFFINTGLNTEFENGVLLGIFGEYSYENKFVSLSTRNVLSNSSIQLGGLAFGLSFGYAF